VSQRTYEIPPQYFFRLHHSRPRFKTDVESVLLFVAESISRVGVREQWEFAEELNAILRTYPGNATKSEKTINNWRTEIAALFSMVRTANNESQPSRNAVRLAESGDLIEFFRSFVLTFQYPGGHVKPRTVADMINHGVRFHPGQFIIRLLQYGTTQLGKPFGVTPSELTHLAFNDLRVTAMGYRTHEDVYRDIVGNRLAGVKYDETGDVVRYAGDVLDYMVLAGLLDHRHVNNRFYIRPQGAIAADAIAVNAPIFDGYRDLYGKRVQPSEVVGDAVSWCDFVNQAFSSALEVDAFGEIVASEFAAEAPRRYEAILSQLRELDPSSAKEIGRVGEAAAILHEQNRLAACGRKDLATKVRKIPDHLGVGYDIASFECESRADFDRRRQVEVKTTRSHSRRLKWFIKLTPPEWSAAESIGEHYFVYRIFLSDDGIRLFVIKDVFGKYIGRVIRMSPRDGAEITFSEDAGEWVEILLRGDGE
jgi:hypothetical protein